MELTGGLAYQDGQRDYQERHVGFHGDLVSESNLLGPLLGTIRETLIPRTRSQKNKVEERVESGGRTVLNKAREGLTVLRWLPTITQTLNSQRSLHLDEQIYFLTCWRRKSFTQGVHGVYTLR